MEQRSKVEYINDNACITIENPIKSTALQEEVRDLKKLKISFDLLKDSDKIIIKGFNKNFVKVKKIAILDYRCFENDKQYNFRDKSYKLGQTVFVRNDVPGFVNKYKEFLPKNYPDQIHGNSRVSLFCRRQNENYVEAMLNLNVDNGGKLPSGVVSVGVHKNWDTARSITRAHSICGDIRYGRKGGKKHTYYEAIIRNIDFKNKKYDIEFIIPYDVEEKASNIVRGVSPDYFLDDFRNKEKVRPDIERDITSWFKINQNQHFLDYQGSFHGNVIELLYNEGAVTDVNAPNFCFEKNNIITKKRNLILPKDRKIIIYFDVTPDMIKLSDFKISIITGMQDDNNLKEMKNTRNAYTSLDEARRSSYYYKFFKKSYRKKYADLYDRTHRFYNKEVGKV